MGMEWPTSMYLALYVIVKQVRYSQMQTNAKNSQPHFHRTVQFPGTMAYAALKELAPASL